MGDLQVKISHAGCTVKDGIITYAIHLPESPEVASTRDQLKQYQKMQSSPEALAWATEQKRLLRETNQCQIASAQYPLRWSAGGLMYTTGTEILTVKKEFPGEPSRLSLFSGTSKTEAEWVNPALTAAREGLEECVMAVDGVHAVPAFPFLDKSQQYAIVDAVKADLHAVPIDSAKTQEIGCRLSPLNGNVVEVYDSAGALEFREKCVGIWLPKAASLDVIFAVELDRDPKTLSMYDTESHEGEFIKRDFVYVPVSAVRERKQELNQELYVKNSWKDIDSVQQVQTTLGKLLMELRI